MESEGDLCGTNDDGLSARLSHPKLEADSEANGPSCLQLDPVLVPTLPTPCPNTLHSLAPRFWLFVALGSSLSFSGDRLDTLNP